MKLSTKNQNQLKESLIYTCISCFVIFGINVVRSQNKIGMFDGNIDIGVCKIKGYSDYSEEDQTYKISGSGTNMWFGEDDFQYLWTTIQGDFILRAEVKFIGKGVDPHRKVGWIVRNNLDDNSKHVNATTHGDGLTTLQYRRKIGGETRELISPDTFPDVIQLERSGNTFIMSTSKFGNELKSVELPDMELDNSVYIGLYVCSHNPDVLESAEFRNVRIIKPVNPDFTPYRDYLGSNLEIMDVESGHRKIIYKSAHSIQAPNWTPEGNRLIYNSKGHLYNYELSTNSITPLNTGFAVNNNNDHVLTFDGALLGISNHNQDDGGTSALFYMSAEGDSLPKMVTKPGVGASYLHGWSPDNSKMVFTGNRNGIYDIYTIDINSGAENQLTNKSTLDDGPEYSPDGEYIFFNSTRTGKMKLWKMKANGEEQTQLTFDEYNDWFPHISPDKKWIAFISFPKDIDPSDHPFYKHCLLRIIPYNGGTPKVIAYIYGGQGSINVPSWSPDSKKIAFVTNTN
ncbi:biopolymer transporter TolR [uncultured Eudoraea sp.]|uniref:TolB family protein n=1 Tax=uncultured Eudoraea sp. TaxID=1035614 RepID=UPI002619229D|nr:biopolymer transporter TolR [uncultured Eudoraea sp.]